MSARCQGINITNVHGESSFTNLVASDFCREDSWKDRNALLDTK